MMIRKVYREYRPRKGLIRLAYISGTKRPCFVFSPPPPPNLKVCFGFVVGHIIIRKSYMMGRSRGSGRGVQVASVSSARPSSQAIGRRLKQTMLGSRAISSWRGTAPGAPGTAQQVETRSQRHIVQHLLGREVIHSEMSAFAKFAEARRGGLENLVAMLPARRVKGFQGSSHVAFVVGSRGRTGW